MSNEAHKQLVTEFFTRLSSSEPFTALDTMTDSCTWWTLGSFPLSGTRGEDELAEMFREYFDTMHTNDILCS
jgi:ketosteroid isomerase-like protein